MSCRHCQREDHAHLRYMGVYTAARSESKKELTKIMTALFSLVWTKVQEERVGVSPVPRNDGFPASSLASHLTEHCRDMLSEEEVVQWCTDNVKVKIQMARTKDGEAKSYNGKGEGRGRSKITKGNKNSKDRDRSASIQKLREKIIEKNCFS